MKKILRLVFVVLFIFGGFNGVGQNYCGTLTPDKKQSEELLKLYNNFLKQGENSLSPSPTNIIYIPVKIHDILRSDGTGEYMNTTELQTIFNYLNSKYLPIGIQFRQLGTPSYYLLGENYYNYSYFTDCVNTNENVLCDSRDYSNAINMYFVGSINGGFSGFARFPINCSDNNNKKTNRVFISKAESYNFLATYTVPHELGHYFNLLHTHHNPNGGKTFELVNRTNCYVEGDQLCDTEADPYIKDNNIENCKRLNILTGSCFWGGSAFGCNYIDTNNQSYNPPINNQMSYWTRGCLDDLTFTSEQYQRIASGYDSRVLNPNPTLSERYYLDGLNRTILQFSGSSRSLACAGDNNFRMQLNSYGDPFFCQGTFYLQMKPINNSYFGVISSNTGVVSVNGQVQITGTIPVNTPAGYYKVRIAKGNQTISESSIAEQTIYVNGTNNGVPTGSPISSQYSNATSTNYNATSTCLGNNITLYADESGYDSYWWTKNGLNYTASSTNSYFNASSTGNYTLNMMKCGNVYRSPNSIYLNFYNPEPSLTAASNGATTDFRLATCEGSPVTLSAGCKSGMNTLWNDGTTSSIRYINASSTRDFFVNCNNYFCNVGYAPPVRVIALNSNVQSQRNGNWQDATLWSSNLVPLNCQTVTIQAGHTVTVPINDAKAKNIIIKGNLNFQNVSPTVKGKVSLGI